MKKVRNLLMKNIHIFFMVSVIALGLVTIIGSGGGGGGSSGGGGSNLTLADLVGTYNLSGFRVTFSDGTVVTENDVTSYSGTMRIESNGNSTQTIFINGVGGTIHAEILSVDNDSMTISSAGCTYDLGIEFSGNVLTTTAPRGTCGIDFSEVDIWTKTGSSVKLPLEDDQTVIIEDSDQVVLGGGMGGLYQVLP